MDALAAALSAVFMPSALLMLLVGVLAGLIVGVVPGVGTIFVLTILLPVANDMNLHAALGLIIGLTAVSGTSDTLPAVLLGVPGSAAGIATVEDGHPMARKGEAGRALGASYSSSLIGGVFGALVLLMLLPVLRPLVLSMRSPDFLAVSIAGLLFVGIVSGKSFAKGVIAAIFGVLLSLVGLDPVNGQDRFTFGQMYLWEGISLSILFIGLFGVVELADLMRRGTVIDQPKEAPLHGVMKGIRDTLEEWRLVLSSSSLGVVLGAMPGIGVTTIDWIAYSLAKRRQGKGPAFGQGNVRGVIAPESANNAKEGGNLIPTLAIGIPGSVGMTFLIAVLSNHGVPPGPQLLTDNVSLAHAIVIFVVLANTLGTLICLLMTRSFARLAYVPAAYIIAVVIPVIVLGALREHLNPLDIVVLILAAVLGVTMKANGWPRPALALGFVLGPNIERYFFLTAQTAGWETLTRPAIVIVLLATGAAVALAVRKVRQTGNGLLFRPSSLGDLLLLLAMLLFAGWVVVESAGRSLEIALFPMLAAVAILLLALPNLARLDRAQLGHFDGERTRPLIKVILLICGFAVVLLFAGITAAVVLFTLLVLPRKTIADVARALVFAAASVGLVHVLFNALQYVSWPEPIVLQIARNFL